jgi:sterol O-acyltransferase
MEFVFEHFLMPLYQDFGLSNHHNKQLYTMLVVGVFGSVIPGTFLLVLMFYCLLHAWLNAFAELMQFADRMFYKVCITVTNRQYCCCYIECCRDSKLI